MTDSRIDRIARRPLGDWGRLTEAFARLGIAWLAMRILRFGRLSRGLGEPNLESPDTVNSKQEVELRRIAWALDAAARRTPWASTCLIRALAGHAMLHRRGINSTLYLGVDPRLKSSTGMAAHAWLRSGPIFVAGGDEKDSFTAVACFADRSGGAGNVP